MTKTIDPQHAAELYGDLDHIGGTTIKTTSKAGPWSLIGRQHIRTARWEEVYWLVVSDEDGDIYGVEYREGLTEEQETTCPWEGSNEPLPLTRLYPHTVTTVEYRTKVPA
jgi:hypothetical protein